MSVSDIIYSVAKEAALKYLTEEISMNDTIMKAAKECGYNSDMIDRICEAANHLVNEVALPKQANRYTEFELADPQRIKAAIHVTEGIASVPYAKGPQQRVVENYKIQQNKVASSEVKEDNLHEDVFQKEGSANIKKSHTLEHQIEMNKVLIGNANRADTTYLFEEFKKLAKEEGFRAASLLIDKIAGEKLPDEIIDYLKVGIADELPESALFKEASTNVYIAPDSEIIRAIDRLSVNLLKAEALNNL